MKLTRTEAIAKYGEEMIARVESANCEPTSRFIYPDDEHYGQNEWMTQEDTPVQAVYFTRPEDDDTIVCGMYDWEIAYFEDFE